MAYLLEGFAALAAPNQPERALQLAASATALRRASGSMLPAGRSRRASSSSLSRPASRLVRTASRSPGRPAATLALEDAVAMALAPAGPMPGLASASTPLPSLAIQSTDAPDPLTAREREVVGLVGQGLTNRQIAERLVVSERTAEWHVANTLGKLGLSTRAQLAVWAAQRLLPTANDAAHEG